MSLEQLVELRAVAFGQLGGLGHIAPVILSSRAR
jgi:hypothetical protein